MELETIRSDEVNPPSFRPILAAWFRQRQGPGCPLRTAIDPFVVPALAPNALLFGVDGDSYTYRLVGEGIRQAIKRKLKGLTAAEVLGADSEYYRLVAAQFRFAVDRMVPLYSVHRLNRPDDRQQVGAWRIVMPYRDGETVTRLLTYQLFEMATRDEDQAEASVQALPRSVFQVVPSC